MEDQTKESTTSTCAEIAKVLNFGAAFWLLAVSCVTVYACVLPWNNIAQDFLLEKYLCPGTCEPEPCCSTVQVSACPAPGCVPATGQPGVFNPTKNDAIKTVSFAMSIPVRNHHGPLLTLVPVSLAESFERAEPPRPPST